MSQPADSMSAEFDTVAEWTAEVAADLGPTYAIPAGCRGSGSPGVLRWFLDRLDTAPGGTFLDCGAGVGGPAAFAAREAGVLPVLTDPEAGACRAARSLFGLPTIRAGTSLPIATGSISAGWSLGVLCTVGDQAAFLAELRRVLRPGARFGLLVYAASHPGRLRRDPPEGNTFPTDEALTDLLHSAALRVDASGRSDDFAATSPTWQEAATAVEAELAGRHGRDPRWQTAERQSDRMGRLLDAGEVVGRLLLVVAV
jgi:SAM-dependent methyltransferase